MGVRRMRNTLALIGALVVGFGGVGWYLGWYKLSFARSPEGNLEIKTDVDTGKVTHDAGDGVKQIGTFLDRQPAHPQQPAPPANTPAPATPAPAGATSDTTVFGFDLSQAHGGK